MAQTLSTIGLLMAGATSVSNVVKDISAKKVVDHHELIASTFWIRLFAGIAFVVITVAASLTGAGRVSPWWLVVVYFIQTLGEMCLSPVGLSTISKLSPVRMVGLMMGVWFLSISIGSYIAGRTTQIFEEGTPAVLTRAFGIFAGITLAAALLLALLTPLIKKMTPRAGPA